MHISALRIANFRRLRNVLIDLADDISVLVGSNNSGKTSTAHALQLFTGSRDAFSIHDFNSECWAAINSFGERLPGAILPNIRLDIWFRIEPADLNRVLDLLPRLRWEGSEVGIRIEFSATDETELLEHFAEARNKAIENIRRDQSGAITFHPRPKTMYEYLTDHLRDEFALKYFVLDRGSFDEKYREAEGYSPNLMTPEGGRSGKDVLGSLVRVDVLGAQRHLSDKSGGDRTEELSRHLSRYYSRNLEKREEDYEAIRALSESQILLDEHLQRVFEPILTRLSEIGYPEHPRLLIRSALNPAVLMSSGEEGAKVLYVLNPGQAEPLTLPDRYNGLGFKNLIYIVVDLLDRHAQWLEIEEERPPLHLIFIEEPEVHLHAQLQQVFIRKVMDILALDGDDARSCRSQFVVTTHSPHILFERGFRPVRYFRRAISEGVHQTCEVLNLSAFYEATEPNLRDFLERYMKLTHCDLFFADAAILVEGNVERLLLPQMIEKVAPRLKSACLSILEVGGAFGYRFRTLIEFLGLTALVITDIDSVLPGPQDGEQTGQEAGAEQTEPADADADEPAAGSACRVSTQGAVTSNLTLINWLPMRLGIAELLAATPEDRTQQPTRDSLALVRMAYQNARLANWQNTTIQLAGRTLEETFALENLPWCQDPRQRDLLLRIPGNANLGLEQLAERLFRRVKGSAFKKTDFALAVLTRNPNEWVVPSYIADGLRWLEDQVTPEAPAELLEAGAPE